MKILVIPDTQIKPGVPIVQMKWAARAVKDYLGKDDYVVHLGDHWDFPSLSSYSSRKEIEGQRVLEDIEAGNAAMRLFWKTLKRMKNKPEFHLLGGNHEDRLRRYCDDNPVLEGVLSESMMDRTGWEFHPYKRSTISVTVAYGLAIYFINSIRVVPMVGRPYQSYATSDLAL